MSKSSSPIETFKKRTNSYDKKIWRSCMKSLLTLVAISFLGASSANALTGMEIFNLCKNEGVEEACKHKTLQNEINEAKSNCNATFSMPSSKRAACEKLKELEKEFTINLQKLKCNQGELKGEECEDL